jgi:hypothetical protein
MTNLLSLYVQEKRLSGSCDTYLQNVVGTKEIPEETLSTLMWFLLLPEQGECRLTMEEMESVPYCVYNRYY